MDEMAGNINRPWEAWVIQVQRISPARTRTIHRSKNSNQIMGSWAVGWSGSLLCEA